MSRLHPFDLVSRALGEGWFAEVEAAARQAGRDPSERQVFQQLGPVQRVLDELLPPSDEAPGAAAEEYAVLLFAMFHFWRGGCRSVNLDRAGFERIIAQDPSVGSLPAGGSRYLQLPERLVWARISPTAPPEPLDGIFVVPSAGGREITVLAILGLRAERDGFSQIAVTVPSSDWERAGSLVRRPLFAPVLEGGERAGLKSVVSEAELLYLAHLALAAASE